MTKLTFLQYFELNKQTSLSCLKICSLLFTGIATAITFTIELTKGSDENPLFVFIVCELFGYALAAFIFVIAILEGFAKTKVVIREFNKIPERVRKDYSIELIQRPLNPKYWFLQLQIVQFRDGSYYELDEQTRREILDNWL